MKPIPLNVLAKQKLPQVLIKGAAIDSRLVKPCDLFFALPGEKVDGHTFLKLAAAKHAAAAVVHSSYEGDDFGLPLWHVSDVRATLQNVGRELFHKHPGKIIGITGSLGKTTTKVFARAFLGKQAFATAKSYNSQVTLPLSAFAVRGNEKWLLLEMGMSEPGEIANLVSIAPPDIALITTVAPQHLNHFPDGVEGVMREKLSILSHPNTKLALLNHALPYDGPKKTFSVVDRAADYFLDQQGNVHAEGEVFAFDLDLPLMVCGLNVIAAIALARTLGVSWEHLQACRLKLPPMRFEMVKKEGIVFINDAYNANPDAMEAALKSLPKTSGKRIAVLSEMDDLGDYAKEGHERVAKAALQHVDELLCIGGDLMEDVWKNEGRTIQKFTSRKALGTALKKLVRPGDVVLLKGARSYALEQVLDQFP